MTDEITLLPCPFCGGDGLSNGHDMGRGVVQCHDCNAYLVTGDEAGAIAAWNRRASQAAPASDGLREALETIRDGYGPNHLSKFALAIASAALSSPTQGGAA